MLTREEAVNALGRHARTFTKVLLDSWSKWMDLRAASPALGVTAASLHASRTLSGCRDS